MSGLTPEQAAEVDRLVAERLPAAVVRALADAALGDEASAMADRLRPRLAALCGDNPTAASRAAVGEALRAGADMLAAHFNRLADAFSGTTPPTSPERR